MHHEDFFSNGKSISCYMVTDLFIEIVQDSDIGINIILNSNSRRKPAYKPCEAVLKNALCNLR